MDITTREALEIATSWLVPGFVVLIVLRIFVPFLRWGINESILGYLAIGSIFATLRSHGVPTILTTLILPAIVGFVLGLIANRWRQIVFRFLPLSPLTAWDAAFWMREEPCLIVVVLKDGTIIQGIYGLKSRASSDPDKRDLFLEGTLVQDETGQWRVDPFCEGLWIDGGQIGMIKFVMVKGGNENGEGSAAKS